MANLDEVLDQEESEWRRVSYQKYSAMNEEVQLYRKTYKENDYEIEIHTKKGDGNDEIIVMVEVSKRSFLNIFVGKAKYFAINSRDIVRDARPDEAF